MVFIVITYVAGRGTAQATPGPGGTGSKMALETLALGVSGLNGFLLT